MKAILEFEAPDTCADCDLHDNRLCSATYKPDSRADPPDGYRRALFCPLRIVEDSSDE